MPPLNIISLLDANNMINKVNNDASTINIEQPWLSKNAVEFDSMSVSEWARKHSYTNECQQLIETMVSNVTGGSGHQISYLYWIRLVAAAGNKNFPGTLGRLIDIKRGAQERKFVG